MATDSQSFEESFEIMQQTSKESKMYVLCHSYYSFLRTNKNPVLTEVYYDFPWYNFSIIERLYLDPTNIKKLGSYLFRKLINLKPLKPNLNFNKKVEPQFISYNEGRPYFDKIIRHVLDRKKKLVIVNPPYLCSYVDYLISHQRWSSDNNYLREIASSYDGISFVDGSQFFCNESNESKYFNDPTHLNQLGKEKFSRWLKSRLLQASNNSNLGTICN